MFLDKVLNWFKPKGKFMCGGTKTIEINDKVSGSKSTITFRIPTGDEVLNYVHAQIQNDTSKLNEFAKVEISSYDMHESIRRKKFVPYARKIITGFDGYVDKNGSKITDVDALVEFYPQHLEVVCSIAYHSDERVKKKS